MTKISDTIIEALLELFKQGVKVLPGLLSALIILFLTKYAVKLVLKIADEAGSRTIKSRSLQLLLLKVSRISVWTIGILLACVLAFPSFELADIIATLGVGSVAIGFAFQDIFKNFLAGIILLVEEPFRIGDEIVIGDYEGKVENISIRTTKIRTYSGERVLLPNSNVFTDAVKVATAYSSRRTDLAVGVDYNTPLSKAMTILEKTIASISGVLEDPRPETEIVNFNDSSIDFIVRYWTAPQKKQLRNVQTRAMIEIKQALDKAEIGIPYPIRTVYHFDQEKYNDYFPVNSKTEDN